VQSGAITSLAEIYPTLRIRDRIALIGINTAYPSSLHLATGIIGGQQLGKLKVLMKQISGQGLFRIVLIHHPPAKNIVSWRKSLTDGASLRKILEEYGAELVLFGHSHKKVCATLDSLSGLVPLMGASSVSSLSNHDGKRSCYYLYTITTLPKGWNLHVQERVFSMESWCFVNGSERDLSFHSGEIDLNR